MNAEGYEATSRDDVAEKVREHFSKLREECETASDQNLTTTLDSAFRPVIDQVTNAQDDAEALRMARIYLDMSHLAIVPMLPARRRSEMVKRSNAITHAMHDYESRSSAPDTLPDLIGSLARCVHHHAMAITEKLEAISCDLRELNTTLQPIGSAQGWSANVLAVLADIDLTMTQSSDLLVGSSAEKTKTVQEILDKSTSPAPGGSGQGTSSKGQAAGGAS
jgi:hypothetical protein